MSTVITVKDGDVVTQRPDAVGRYMFEGDPPQDIAVSSWKPADRAVDLRARLGDRVITVSRGSDGARYRITGSDGRLFDVRVSSTRPVTTAPDDAPAAGSALAQAVKR